MIILGMKRMKMFCDSLGFLLLVVLINPVLVKANMLPTNFEGRTIWNGTAILVLVWYILLPYFGYPLFNWLVEVMVAKFLLRKRIPVVKGFMKSFFIINFISYYPALFTYRRLYSVLWGWLRHIRIISDVDSLLPSILSLIIVELGVVVLEYFLITWRMKRMYPDLVFNKQTLSKGRIWLISLVANLISFLLGKTLVMLIAIFMSWGEYLDLKLIFHLYFLSL